MRKYGPEKFEIFTLEEHPSQQLAQEAEVRLIALYATQKAGMNISPGGEYDSASGAEGFRNKLKSPSWKEKYRAKLSRAVLNSPAHQAHVKDLSAIARAWAKQNPGLSRAVSLENIAKANQWRGMNPEKSLKMSRAAGIIGRKKIQKLLKEGIRFNVGPMDLSPEQREKRREHAASQWKRRREMGDFSVHKKIGRANVRVFTNLTVKEKAARDSQLAEARNNIDHTLRKANQKAALIAYWTPERRAEKARKMRELHARKNLRSN